MIVIPPFVRLSNSHSALLKLMFLLMKLLDFHLLAEVCANDSFIEDALF